MSWCILTPAFCLAVFPLTRTLVPHAHGSVARTVLSDTTEDTTHLKRPPFPKIGQPAPPLRVMHWLHTDSGSPVLRFGDGHIYLLDFTAIWCGSCPQTYPILSDLLKKYGPATIRPIFVTKLYGFAEDHSTEIRPAEELATLPAYFARHAVTAPVAVLDSVHSGMRAYTDNGQGEYALPKLVLIDGQGIVRDVMTGWDADRARTQLFADVAQLVAATSH